MAKSTSLVTFCTILTIWPPLSTSIKSMDCQLERAEQIGGQDFTDWQLRVRKFNRTTHSLNGTITLLQDLDESYEVTMNYAYSSLGNNQFNEYPMKLPRKKVCQYMVEEYREFQYIWADDTNMPQVERDARVFCPFPVGTYWVRDIAPEAAWIPPVVPTGLWRMTIGVWRGADEPVLQIVFYFRLTRKLTM